MVVKGLEGFSRVWPEELAIPPFPKTTYAFHMYWSNVLFETGSMPRPPESVLSSYLSTCLFLGTSGSFDITSIAVPYYGTLDAKQGLDRAALG